MKKTLKKIWLFKILVISLLYQKRNNMNYTSEQKQQLAFALNNNLKLGGYLNRKAGQKISDLENDEQFKSALSENGMEVFITKVKMSKKFAKINNSKKAENTTTILPKSIHDFLSHLQNNPSTIHCINSLELSLPDVVCALADTNRVEEFKNEVMTTCFNNDMSKKEFLHTDMYYSICKRHKLVLI